MDGEYGKTSSLGVRRVANGFIVEGAVLKTHQTQNFGQVALEVPTYVFETFASLADWMKTKLEGAEK